MTGIFLYAVAFLDSKNVRRVVVLHANDEEDAVYCVSEGWGKVSDAKVTLLSGLRVGHMLPVYEKGE